MSIVLCITLVMSYALFSMLVYRQNLQNMKAEVKQEAIYLSGALNAVGDKSLQKIVGKSDRNRVTLIDTDGTVIFDSRQLASKMENHKYRVEIKEAQKSGTGIDTRVSSTLGERTFYYAIKLDDGSILRLSKTMGSVWETVASLLPMMGLIAVIMLIFALAMSKWQTARLIEPINKLDLEHPLQNEIYEELSPLLMSVDTQNREKEKIAQMRKEFSANVSHELKTPLTSISGYAEIMKNGLVKAEDIPGFADRIYHEASRLITLVEDIIKLSKLDEESVELEKEEVDLFVLAREICSRLAPQAERTHVHLEVTGESVFYRGIKQILDEMIYNICENAIKYNKADGTVSVWVGNTLQGKKVIVTDNGIGIPLEEQERIFERFYRVDKSHSKETGGTGLGLSIVKHGALLHHANIKVSSSVGQGTRMEITF